MSKCDYCCIRPSSLIIYCLKYNQSSQINISVKCSVNLNDIPLDDNCISEFLSNDEINLIEMIESYIYLSRQTSHIIFIFQSFKNNKQLHGENHINGNNIQLKYLIYPPMLIDSEQQKLLTHMPCRDEYQREYLNQPENRLPILNNDQ
ncbi:unnamed protein product [Rotaria sp. Silwood1]|nr:unnamed protein product [Rotaria sp. Silwood1]CAF1632104.1 unnamed protein product [Rotaria sp. Silwood1]